MLFCLFLLSSGAYLPKRVLILSDQDATVLNGFLSIGEVPVQVQTVQDGKITLPALYEGGSPVYSHIVLFGNSLTLSAEDADALAAFSDGRLDPMHSRLTSTERVTLPLKNGEIFQDPQATANGTVTILTNTYTFPSEKKHSGVFEPLPGGSIMILSNNPSMEALLQKLGAYVARGDQEKQSNELYYMESDLWPTKAPGDGKNPNLGTSAEQGHLIIKRFRNKRTPFNGLICNKKNHCLTAVWRGVANNARAAYFGNDAIVSATLESAQVGQQATSVLITLSRWFMFNSGVIRAKEFDYQVINIPNSKCAQQLHLSQAYGDRVREGNLILLKLRLEQSSKNGWIPKQPLKTYNSFQSMIDSVGYPKLNNVNFKSVLKKQKAMFEPMYDTCIQETLESYLGQKINNNDYVYTSLQFRERFIQDWYVMNAVYHAKSGMYYALIVPDLTRSYTVGVDVDTNTASRLNIKMRIHVRPTRLESERITIANLPWQISILFTSALSFIVALISIIEKDVPVQVQPHVEELLKKKFKNAN